MVKKPRLFLFISFALACIMVSFPLQVVMLYDHGLSELLHVFRKISFLNLMVMSLLGYTSYLAYHASPYLKYVAPVTIVAVLWNNLVTGSYATDFSMAASCLATLGFSLLFTPLFHKKARFILADGKNRWWFQSRRHKRQVTMTLNPYVGDTLLAQTFDISKTGAFVHVDQADGTVPDVGETLRISLNVGGMRNVRCEAKIVRINEDDKAGAYPKGVGIEFKGMDKQARKDLERFLKSQH